MATIDLGKIKMVYRGIYDASTAYTVDDVVQFTDSGVTSSYICTTNSTGNNPSSSGTAHGSWSYIAKGTALAGLTWESSIKTAAFTAVASKGYFVNTTGGAFAVTLPASPQIGDTLQLVDYAGTFASYPLEIDPGSEKINGSTEHKYLSGQREGASLTFTDATQGWMATDGVNEGTASLSGAPYTVTYLVVGGGGGSGDQEAGSKYSTGGGGAGGYRTGTVTITPGVVYTASIGDGGAVATQGGASSLSGDAITTIESAGGGAGGHNAGGNGGSGGGSGNNTSGGSGNTPSTSPSQGNDGGNGFSSANTSGGGGGGASAAGSNGGTSSNGGSGGAGSANSITGSSVTYAGGGGGGSGYSGSAGSSAGSGGAGGGGSGSTGGFGGVGTDGLGGGAGGGRGDEGSSPSGRSGGSGVVILSVPTASYSGTVTGGPSVSTSGSNKIIQFTGTGSITG